MKIQTRHMKASAEKATKLLKTLANPARLMILCQLIGGEQGVGDLWSKSALSQSAFSQHLAVLRRAKIIAARKDAQNVYYSLANDNAVKVLELMYRLYCT